MRENKALNIGIIGGKGRMGGLFEGLGVKSGFKVFISDLHTSLTNVDIAKKCDVIFVSVPIHNASKVLVEIKNIVRPELLVVEMTSLKSSIIPILQKFHCHTISIHPMFNDTAFSNGQRVLISPLKSSRFWILWLKNFLRSHGLNCVDVPCKQHDLLMSYIQALIHCSDLSFVHTLKNSPYRLDQLLPISTPHAADKIAFAGRMLAQDPDMYGHISIDNAESVKILKAYYSSLKELLDIIRDRDITKFHRYFNACASYFGKYRFNAFKETDRLIKQLPAFTSEEIYPKATYQKSIFILGPQYSYSDLACNKLFQQYTTHSNTVSRIYLSSISEIFDYVKKASLSIALVPIENSLDGSIQETLDNLFKNQLVIYGEMTLPIHHCLAVHKGGSLKSISTIVSNEKAINQCKSFINKYLSHAKLLHYVSTSASLSALKDSNRQDIAVIASPEGAKAHGLDILKYNIEDSAENATHFILIGKKSASQMVNLKNDVIKFPHKTSLSFYFAKNKPGLLYNIFKYFSDKKINLTKIESRPSKKEFGDYIFYLDFEGSIDDLKTKGVLEKIRMEVAELKIFGSYPVLC